MKIIAITTVFLVLFFTNSAISKEKTIKFHKPQTEAEKALDEILRVENGLIKGSKLKREDMFTKGFIEDYERRSREYVADTEFCKSCQRELCFDCYIEKVILDWNEIPYYFNSKIDIKDNFIIYWKSAECKNHSVISAYGGEYYMKKEDGKWKIDGFNTGEYDGELQINIDYNNESYNCDTH